MKYTPTKEQLEDWKRVAQSLYESMSARGEMKVSKERYIGNVMSNFMCHSREICVIGNK